MNSVPEYLLPVALKQKIPLKLRLRHMIGKNPQTTHQYTCPTVQVGAHRTICLPLSENKTVSLFYNHFLLDCCRYTRGGLYYQ